MDIVALFNNKGGVGKTTLAFHIAHILAEMGHKTLLMDLDPQCNLTIMGIDQEELHCIWKKEDAFIENFQEARDKCKALEEEYLDKVRSIHFLLKPTEDGIDEPLKLSKPLKLTNNLH